MTICIAVNVPEGLVLAADSMSTIMDGQGQVVQLFEHAQKLTQLSNYPIGTMTWGMGSIAQRTIDSLVYEFSQSLPPLGNGVQIDVSNLAQQLSDFVTPRYAGHYQANPQLQQSPVGMLVGGYSSGAFFADVYSFQLPTAQTPTDQLPDLPDGSPNFNVLWYGLTDPLLRLMNGADVNLLQAAMGANFSVQAAQDLFDQFAYPVLVDMMPLQDAVDFATYLANVVVGRFRFVTGMPLCGGEIDVATITRDNGFEWLKRKTRKVR